MGTPVNRPSRKPSFLWQGVLILAPVLVLAGIGGYALWKDQRLAVREAEARAQELADQAAGKIWDELEKAGLPAIQFDRSGKLLVPKPYDEVPAPYPLDEAASNTEQRRLWHAAQMAFTESNRTNVAELFEKFLKTNPPREFAAVAHFKRGLALEQTGQRSEAGREFAAVIDRFSGALSEAGLPLDFLARAHIQPRSEFVRYAIEHPCALTRQIIAELSGAEKSETALIRTQWAQEEELRWIAAAARTFFTTNQSAAVSTVANVTDRAERQVEALFDGVQEDKVP